MGNIITLNCPSCGGTLKVNEGDKNAYCEYCNSHYIISTRIGIERYYVKPVSGLTDFFRERNIKIIESKIIFIPILKIKTEIFGWIYLYRKGKVITYQVKDEKGRMRTYTVRIDESRVMKPVNTYREVTFSNVKKMRVGIERIDLKGIEILPYDDEMMHRFGFVMDLSEGIEKIKNNSLSNIIKRFLIQFSDYDKVKHDLECVLPHFSIIYYPVLTVRTNIGYYVLDGVRKNVIYKEEKKEERRKIKIKNYYIPIFTMMISLFSSLNIFIGIITFIALFILLVYSYGD